MAGTKSWPLIPSVVIPKIGVSWTLPGVRAENLTDIMNVSNAQPNTRETPEHHDKDCAIDDL